MPSRRAVAATYLALAVAVSVVLTVFVWPGFYSSFACGATGVPTESANQRTYCAATVPVPERTANYTEWHYVYELKFLPTPAGPELAITIIEPNGVSSSGQVGYVGPTAPEEQSWFTPDGSAGIRVIWTPVSSLTLLADS
jgi:hypothetical protein